MNTDINTIASQVVTAATKQGLVLTTAESCTGGMVAAALTDLAGASRVFDRSYITYSNGAKIDLLGVEPSLLESYGAVSGEVVEAMAIGAYRNITDSFLTRGLPRRGIAISISGIAGPGGGSKAKPVGTVWFGLCKFNEDEFSAASDLQCFTGNRQNIREAATLHALKMLLQSLAE